MHDSNLIFAWFWILTGLVAGAMQGIGFHRDDWMGGYDSWRRRLTRLGHIAFLGTAMINLAFAFTLRIFNLEGPMLPWVGWLLILGAASMPVVCYLAAWRKSLRNLFVVPVLSLIGGVSLFVFAILSTDLPGATP